MAYSNLHQSAKGKQNLTGLTIGGQGLAQQQQVNTAGGVYGLTSAEHDSVRGMQNELPDAANQEDLIMMNIPREGNAD